MIQPMAMSRDLDMCWSGMFCRMDEQVNRKTNFGSKNSDESIGGGGRLKRGGGGRRNILFQYVQFEQDKRIYIPRRIFHPAVTLSKEREREGGE